MVMPWLRPRLVHSRALIPQQLSTGQSAIAFIRPEAMSVVEGSSALENIVKCTVENLSFEGPFATVFLKTDQNQAFVLRQNNDGSTPFLQVDAKIEVGFVPIILVYWHLER